MTVISVIIATHNRCEILKRTLDSLLKQDSADSFDYEILVVDNNSTDGTKSVIESYQPKFNGRLKYLFASAQGKSFALNKGLEEANGVFMAFTDDDVLVDPFWLRNIYDCIQKYEPDAMGGRVEPLYPEVVPSWIRACQQDLNGPIVSYGYGQLVKVYDDSMLPFIGANMIVKRKIFSELGGFRTDLGPGRGTLSDDSEFFKRLVSSGKVVYYCGNALVHHPVESFRLRVGYAARWFIRQGRGYVRTKKFGEIVGPCCFGIPRHMLRETFAAFLKVLFCLHNPARDFKEWRIFFIRLGMVLEHFRIFWNTKKEVC